MTFPTTVTVALIWAFLAFLVKGSHRDRSLRVLVGAALLAAVLADLAWFKEAVR